jgi:hypothetical protein
MSDIHNMLIDHRPTIRPLDEVVAAFNNLSKPIQNNSALNDFLNQYFGEAGSEIEPVPTDQLQTEPDFLENVNSSTVADFVSQVIGIWRKFNSTDSASELFANCIIQTGS